MIDNSLRPLTDTQLRQSIRLAALLAVTLPPFIGGGVVMTLMGFYPAPEFFLIFFHWHVVIYIGGAIVISQFWANRMADFICQLPRQTQLAAHAIAERRLKRLPWLLIGMVTLYSMGGAMNADIAMETMGIKPYSLEDHLRNQLGLIPVVLITIFPIYFYLADRMGRYLGPRDITVTTNPLWVKLIMLGIVTPMLIDSTLVGYFINHTGHFNLEIFLLWASLLALAIGGTALAWFSLSQGLSPLRAFVDNEDGLSPRQTVGTLKPLSLDELGVLTARYANLLGREHVASSLANTVIDQAGALVVVLNREGRIVRFNQACEKLSGYTFAEVKGQYPWNTVLPPEDADFVRQNAFEAMVHAPQRLSSKFTNDWLAKSGERYRIEWMNSLLLDEQGQVEFMICFGIDVTSRYRMEQQLLLKDAALASASNGFAIAGMDGRLIYVNPEFLHLWRYTNEGEVIGKHASEFWLHPEEADPAIQEMQQNGIWAGEIEAKRQDGSVFYAATRASLVRDRLGMPSHMLGVFIDITDRKQTEAILQQNEARLNEAQRIARVGSWELDLTSKQLHWTNEVFNLFELDKASFEASYDAFLNAIHPDDRDAVNTAYTQSLEKRSPYTIVHRLLMADGRIKWVEERCTTDFAEDGTPLISRGTVQDITEQHELMQALRKLNNELEQRVEQRTQDLQDAMSLNQEMLKASTVGISAYRSTGECVFANDAIAHLINAKHDQVLAQNFRAIPSWQQYGLLPLAEKCLDTGIPQHGEFHMLTSFGREAWFDTTFARFKRSGESHLLVLLADITDRKRAEQALIDARDIAERASQAKSEFLSRMSHELRTPMNAIIGFAQLLGLESLTPDQLDSVDEISRAGDHLLELINDLLDLSRIESGKMAVVMEPVDLKKIVAESSQIVHAMADKKRVSIINGCIADVAVISDPTRLRQILVNLMSNAIKYNHTGGRVLVDCSHQGKEHIRIAVTDTGPGIPPEQLPRLFKPFDRLGAELKGIDGVGIGLSLSQQLAEMMGSNIAVSSTHGEGSSFWLDVKISSHRQTSISDEIAQPDHSKMASVLYVEDNASNLKLAASMFKHMPDLRLISATNGEFGLELAQRYRPDVILLDIHLPGMDGYEVLDVLQGNPATRDIPVLALSADAMPIDIEQGLKAGFREYLTKPIDIDHLQAALARALQGKRTPLSP